MSGWNISSHLHLKRSIPYCLISLQSSLIYDPKTGNFVQNLAQNWRKRKNHLPEILRSAYIFFNRAYSSLSSFSRLNWLGDIHPYLAFQLKKVALLIPFSRQISATVIPLSC